MSSIIITGEDANAIVESYLKTNWDLTEPKIEVCFDSDTKPYYHVYSYVRFKNIIYKKLTRISLDGFKSILLQALMEQKKPIDRVGLLQEKGNVISYALHCKKKKKRSKNRFDRAQQIKERIQSEEQTYRAQLSKMNYAPVFIVNNRKKQRQETIINDQNKKLRKEHRGK